MHMYNVVIYDVVNGTKYVHSKRIPVYRPLTGHSGAGDGTPGPGGGETTPPQATGGDHSTHSRVPREEGVACQGLQNITVSLQTCTCVAIRTPFTT